MEKASSGECTQSVFKKEGSGNRGKNKLLEVMYKNLGKQNIEFGFLK